MDRQSVRQQVNQELKRIASLYRADVAFAAHITDARSVMLHPEILIMSPHNHFNAKMSEEVSKMIKEKWGGLEPRFQTCNIVSGYPPILRNTSQIWFFFFADRVDTHEEPFSRWVDDYRGLLDKVLLVPFRWYTKQQLTTVGESLYDSESNVEIIAGHEYAIIDMETPDILFAPDSVPPEAIYSILAILTLQAYRSVAPRPSYNEFWTDRTAAATGAMRADIKKLPKSAVALDEALPVVYGLHRIISRWDDLCSRAENLGELPSCESGTQWDRMCRTAFDQCIKDARDHIYHVSKASNEPSGGEPHTGQYAEAFTEFQQMSDKLSRISEALSQDLDRRGESEKAGLIRQNVKDSSRKLQVILYGPFSAGKTTFLNTLFGLSGKAVLPVKGTPTTSTFNFVEYGDKDSFTPCYHEELEHLRFIDSPSHESMAKRLRVHKEEIAAFLSWVDDDMLKKDNLRVRIRKRRLKSVNIEEKDLSYNESHRMSLSPLPDSKHDYEDSEKVLSEGIPLSVRGVVFTRHYDVGSFRELEGFGPKAALMIQHIVVKRNHDHLRHISIVDTPGVDSCIPYHHTMSRSYIEAHPSAPVICFIDGKRTGGEADKANIENLIKLSQRGSEHLGLQNRTFFLITKRNEIAEKDRKDVLDMAEKVISERGWQNPLIHMVDSVAAANSPDDRNWLAFTSDIQKFIGGYQIDYLRNIAEELSRILQSWISNEVSKLKEMSESENIIRAKCSQRSAFVKSAEVFINRDIAKRTKIIMDDNKLYGHWSQTFQESVAETIKDLHKVECSAWLESTKNERVCEMKACVDGLGSGEDWKIRIFNNTKKYSSEIAARMNKMFMEAAEDEQYSFIRDELKQIRIIDCQPSGDFVPILWEQVISARNSDGQIESTFLGWYDDGLKQYRSRIIRALNKMLGDSMGKTNAEFYRICNNYESQAKSKLTDMEKLSSASLAADKEMEYEKANASKRFYEQWRDKVNNAFGIE